MREKLILLKDGWYFFLVLLWFRIFYGQIANILKQNYEFCREKIEQKFPVNRGSTVFAFSYSCFRIQNGLNIKS